ncbi:MAG: hypothetical protein KatS3mg124_1003 [Porticoccaceae bacterium]|nr:MAG: hypothetical protein KatS3mg124_1003 [Porticoccaceae bacterium]
MRIRRAAKWPLLVLVVGSGCTTPTSPERPPVAATPPVASAQAEAPSSIPASSKASPLHPTTAPRAEAGASADLWAALRAELTFSQEIPDRLVAPQLNRYAADQRLFESREEELALFLPLVFQEVRAAELPAELALLPLVESAYDPRALSPGGAAGLWQIRPTTASHLDLDRTPWYDGRRDVLESTRAALNYLVDLHRRFEGDWLLALAAYNAGPNTVARAVARNRAQGLPTDFWSLSLNPTTTRHVSRLVALGKVVASPDRYGVALPSLPATPPVRLVDVETPVSLSQVAEWTGLPMELIETLNPGFVRPALPPARGRDLLLPTSVADALADHLATLAAEEAELARYRTRPGDSLWRIARAHGTTVETIARLNDLDPAAPLAVGIFLRVPKNATPPPGSPALRTAAEET